MTGLDYNCTTSSNEEVTKDKHGISKVATIKYKIGNNTFDTYEQAYHHLRREELRKSLIEASNEKWSINDDPKSRDKTINTIVDGVINNQNKAESLIKALITALKNPMKTGTFSNDVELLIYNNEGHHDFLVVEDK